MSFKPFASLFRSRVRTNRRGRSTGRRRFPGLFLERLEDRTVPTVVIDPALGAQSVSWTGGGNPPGLQGPFQTDVNNKPIVTSPLTGNPTALTDPAVYLIFLGPDFVDANNKPNSYVDQMVKAAQAVLQSPFFQVLANDYGLGKLPSWGDSAVDSSAPGTLEQGGNPMFLATQKILGESNHASWYPGSPTAQGASALNSPIYCVVHDDGGDAGSNDYGPNQYTSYAINACDISLGKLGSVDSIGNSVNQFTRVLTHEVAERYSSGVGAGFGVLSPLQQPQPGQPIGYGQCSDAEPDTLYYYRLNNSYWESAYWSTSAHTSTGTQGAYIVPDNNNQTVYLTPNWTNVQLASGFPSTAWAAASGTFQGNFVLTIDGDQLANKNDNITLDVNNNGGIRVTLNGEVFQFDSGKISQVVINSGSGSNTISIRRLSAGQTVTINSAGSDTVQVGFAHDITAFNGTLNIINHNSQGVKLTVDDSLDGTGRTVTQTLQNETFFTTLSWSSLGKITYAPQTLTTLRILGGHGNNTFSFAASTSNCTTTIDTGDGNDNVTFQATSGVLNVVANPPSSSGSSTGQDTVTIGSPTPTLNGDSPLFGAVNVSNHVGSTALIIDDSADLYPNLTFTVNGGAITNNSPIAAPARISDGAGVNSVEFHIGSGGTTFNVLSSYNKLTLDSTTGKDTINLGDARHNLNAIANVSVNGRGNTTVNVNDRGNASAYFPYLFYIPELTAYTIGGERLTRSAVGLGVLPGFSTPVGVAATLSLSYYDIAALNVTGGPVGVFTYQVTSTLGANAMTLKASGTDIVTVGSPSSNLNDVAGLTVNGNGSTKVTVDDRGNESPPFLDLVYTPISTAYTIGNQSLSRVAQGFAIDVFGQPVFVTAALSLRYSNLAGLTIDGGPGGGFTYRVQSTIGTNAITFNALGVDTVSLGAPGANLDGLAAPIQVNGNGATAVTVDDRGNSGPFLPYAGYIPIISSYTITAGSLTRFAQGLGNFPGVGLIPVVAGFSLGYGGLANLTIEGGPAGVFSYQVDSTAGAGNVTINARSADIVVAGDSSHNLDNISNLSVNGNGSTTMVVDDQANQNSTLFEGSVAITSSPVYQITNSSVTRVNNITTTQVASGQVFSTSTITGVFNYSGLGSLTVHGGSSGNVFNVTSTAPSTTVVAGNGGDTVNVGSATTNLDGIGTLTVSGGTGTTLNLNDQANQNSTRRSEQGGVLVLTSPTYAISGQGVTRTNVVTTISLQTGLVLSTRTLTATINFTNVGSLSVLGGQSGNTFDILGTGAGTPVTISAGAGDDSFNVGSAAGTLDPIQGPITVNGNGANSTLNVHDDGNNVSENYTVSPTSIQRSIIVAGIYNFNIAPINYYSVGHVAVYVGTAQMGLNQGAVANTLDVVGTEAGTVTDLYGNNNGGQTAFAAYPYVFNYAGPILGAVHFHGSSIGFDTVSYVDYFNPAAQSYTMTAGRMVDNGFAPVTYDGRLYGVDLETSVVGGNKVNVISTAAIGVGTAVEANAGDLVTVGSQAPNLGGSLAGLAGSGILSIHSIYASSAASVILDDSADTQTGKQVTFTDVSSVWEVNGLASQVIELTLSSGSSVQVQGGSPAAGQSGSNTYDIESVPAGVSLALTAGTGNDPYNVGSAANTLDPIQGAVTINGGGNASLNFNDQGGNPGAAPNQAFNYSLAQNSFRRTGTATITFGGMAAVNLYAANAAGSGGFNDLGVASTAPSTTYSVYAGTGLNEFLVFDINYTLNGIQGPLYLHGTGGFIPNDDLVFLNDIDKTTQHTFFVNAGPTSQSGMVQRFNTASNLPDMATIHYDGLNAYSTLFTSGSAGATINVQSQAPDLFTIIGAGNGDTVNIGSPAHSMDTMQGDLRIQGVLGQKPTVNVDDSGDTSSRTIAMRSDTVYTYLVTGLFPQGSGRGRLYFELDPATPVTLKTGNVAGSITNDVFQPHDFTNAPALKIDAGNGSNTLDYSGYTGDITVDLASGSATGLAGISNFQNAIGSNGNSLIVGDANAHDLTGGTGRNIIIGGAGLDTITGGGGDNLLIGGSTVYDSTNLSALELIMKEWLQPSDFATRMLAIENGTDLLAGTGFKLDASTIIPDGLPNVINPGPGANWIIP